MTDNELKSYACISCKEPIEISQFIDTIGHLKGFVTKKVECKCGAKFNISICKDVKKSVWKDIL